MPQPEKQSPFPCTRLRLAFLLAGCALGIWSGHAAEDTLPIRDRAQDSLRSIRNFERSMAHFWNQHGYHSFRRNIGDYLVGSPIFRAQPNESKDRLAPRAVLLRFIAYAASRQKDLISLSNALVELTPLAAAPPTGIPPGSTEAMTAQGLAGAFQAACSSTHNPPDQPAALARLRTLLGLHQSVLLWLQFQYACIIQDSELALARPALLFEDPLDPSWQIAFSPGVFSLLVRGPDIEALHDIGRRLLAYPALTKTASQIEGLLPDRASFLHQALKGADLGPAGDEVRRCLSAAGKNPYERLYWDYALGLFSRHVNGHELFGQVCRMAVRLGTNDMDALYWRLREAAFPDNTECIWPRRKMSRFDPRILEIATAARSPTVLEEMTKVQAEIHRRLRAGKLRPGGIAEFTRGRLHGMDDFLNFGVGGCEAFSIFITTPLLSLGRSGVHPVFIGRPYQPWGHWIAGADSDDTLYVCDGESADFGPPVPAMEFIARVMKTAAPPMNRYVNLRIYSQTLASWEWEYLLEGADKPANIKKVLNPLYATYRHATRTRPPRAQSN